MSDSTNLDLWQVVSTVGSVDLELGASPDVVASLVGSVDGFNIGAPELLVADLISPITLHGQSDPATPEQLTAELVQPVHVAVNCTGSPELIEGTVILCATLGTVASASHTQLDLRYIFEGGVTSTHPTPVAELAGGYDLNVNRDPTGFAADAYLDAPRRSGDALEYGWDQSARFTQDIVGASVDGGQESAGVEVLSGSIPPVKEDRNELYSECLGSGIDSRFIFEALEDGTLTNSYAHTEALEMAQSKEYLFYDTAPRLFSTYKDSFESSLKVFELLIGDTIQKGATLTYSCSSLYEQAGYPAPGRKPPYVPPVVPVPEVRTDLDLSHLHDGTNNLEFYWADDVAHVIPVKKAYYVMNEVRLHRASDNAEIDLLSMTLDIDRDAWAWGFKVTVPYSFKESLVPTTLNSPVLLDLSVNGTVFKVLAEKIAVTRAFGAKTLSVSGRGISAYLSSPYAATQTFSSSSDATAQQLANTALTTNGQSIGWEVDWGLTDWVVPAGTFSVRGSYIDALKDIAEAAGAFILPDPSLKKLSILPLYPSAPWHWDTASIDYQVPSSVAQQESIEYVEKPAYNSVYVMGQKAGSVMVKVNKENTIGDYNADSITHSLITDVYAARQRGIAELSQTGLMATIKLSLPILPETGIIMPGKLLRYVDGTTEMVGVTKSVTMSKAANSILRQEVEFTVHG